MTTKYKWVTHNVARHQYFTGLFGIRHLIFAHIITVRGQQKIDEEHIPLNRTLWSKSVWIEDAHISLNIWSNFLDALWISLKGDLLLLYSLCQRQQWAWYPCFSSRLVSDKLHYPQSFYTSAIPFPSQCNHVSSELNKKRKALLNKWNTKFNNFTGTFLRIVLHFIFTRLFSIETTVAFYDTHSVFE